MDGLLSEGVFTSLQGVFEGLINGEAYIRRGLYIFVRGFRRAYKWRDFYPRGFINLRKGF